MCHQIEKWVKQSDVIHSVVLLTFSIFSATNILAFSAMTPAASAAYVCACRQRLLDHGVIMTQSMCNIKCNTCLYCKSALSLSKSIPTGHESVQYKAQPCHVTYMLNGASHCLDRSIN